MELNVVLRELGPIIVEEAESNDVKGQFVEKNLELLRANGIYKMCIPESLGGHGVSYTELCSFIKEIGKCCSSTGLTLSMHQHLVCGLVFKSRAGDQLATKLLNDIASQDLILLSTGGGDWVSSNGQSEKVPGGYKINCRKSFCSGAPMADMVLMSCVAKEEDHEIVMHFYLPMNTKGINVLDDWKAMGMKGTGSCTVCFEDVFVPEQNIMLKRKRGEWHPALNAVSTFTFPIVVSVYSGVLEALVEKTVELLSKRETIPSHVRTSLGEMHNHFKITQWAYGQLVVQTDNLTAQPSEKSASEAHQAKAIFSQHAIKSAQAAMEALGGYSYYKKAGVERLYRDLVAGDFHPMQVAKQKEVLGGVLLGMPLKA